MNPAWVVLAVSIATASVAASAGECDTPESARADSADVWLVSTRRLPDASCGDDAEPDFWRLAADAQWTPADARAFLAADRASIPTVFFFHGNRWDADRAVGEGMGFCEQLAGLGTGAKFRFVVWSWPADRIARRNRPDLRAKDVRSRREAVYLARLLQRMSPDVPISLVGYSYGAQTILGALTLLAGENYAGFALEHRGPARRAPLAAVLIAGAIEAAVLACDGGTVLGQVDRLLVTRNGCDPVLRFYPRLYRGRGPEALGYVGPGRLDPDDPNARKVEVVDVSHAVGKRHDWQCYRDAWPLRARLAWFTLFEQAERGGPSRRQSE